MRAPQNTRITEEADERWRVAQVIRDHDEDNDWLLEVTADLPRSRAAQRPVLTRERIGT